MKAPEKIFRTTTYLDNDKGKVVWKETPVNGAENIEYIRKDALLEYLTGRKKELLSGESFVSGERKMLKEIIEKIESL